MRTLRSAKPSQCWSCNLRAVADRWSTFGLFPFGLGTSLSHVGSPRGAHNYSRPKGRGAFFRSRRWLRRTSLHAECTEIVSSRDVFGPTECRLTNATWEWNERTQPASHRSSLPCRRTSRNIAQNYSRVRSSAMLAPSVTEKETAFFFLNFVSRFSAFSSSPSTSMTSSQKCRRHSTTSTSISRPFGDPKARGRAGQL